MARIQTTSQVSSQSPLNSLKRFRVTGHLHYKRVTLCCSIKQVSVLRYPLHLDGRLVYRRGTHGMFSDSLSDILYFQSVGDAFSRTESRVGLSTKSSW